ncbi:Ubiquitin--protein ligase [Handroanthus impetiginosus]|uniref:RING-type E3 ubiquitin transferase n=1 Tax=Handroanthus impetiginosus TaxID=429701 RepID=A0A2G9H5A2_9LAMI|nr:Ubiquitin--protein ligase [Handroanthus impetiginosus]PIN12694.1 Ubiquitin--protein ligase [Handroanthus impetiginosus]
MEELTFYQSFVYFHPDFHKKFSFTTRHEPIFSSSSSLPPELYINFELSCEPHDAYWVFREHSRRLELLRLFPLPPITKFIRLNLGQFLDQEYARQTIAEGVIWWPLPECCHQILLDFALDKAQEVVKSMPASHNAVHLNISVLPQNVYVFTETELMIRWATQRSMEEGGNCMVPAANSVIESLENMKITLIADDFGTCSVCLEEFSKGCEVVCMPCSHVFHGDCIQQWLKTSHYCPICRFEMPTT